MSYRQKFELETQTVEDFAKTRQFMPALFPLLAFQQGAAIFADSRSDFSHWLAIVAWIAVTLAVISLLLGWRVGGMSKEDHSILNDDWHRETSADAMRAGFVATLLTGMALVIAEHWVAFDAMATAYVTVNAAIASAGIRYAWLNWGSEDEE